MNETRILVVDDSRIILQTVEAILSDANYNVHTALSGDGALANIQKYGLPHIALIDLNMPGMDGFSLCKKIHKFSDLPIIILTADDDEKSMVKGLTQFAEDYITKPFKKAVLLARVERVLRRMGDFNYTLDPTVSVDERLQISLANRKVVVAGEEKKLTPIEAKFLYLLMKQAGRTVSTDYILRRIWPLDEAFEDRLHAHVYRLRKKIESDPKEPTYILSDWSRGYSFPLMD